MWRADQKPRRRRIAWIVASLAFAVGVALTGPPAASAQQGSAQAQYKLNLPSGTGSSGQPGASSANGAADRLAGTGRDDTGVLVSVLAIGLAAISCAGGLVAYRRRQTADHTP
jgi:hypothetical protein